MKNVNKALELLSTLITSDFPDEKIDLQNTFCFCATELLTSLQEKTIRNILNNTPTYNSTDLFNVCVYAVFEDGHTGKYWSLVPIMLSHISSWTFNLLDEYWETTHSRLAAFAIYLIQPSVPQTPCIHMVIHKY